ncbi:MAG: M24 family metallopeptidase [Steroidobacteraceae bacterium]
MKRRELLGGVAAGVGLAAGAGLAAGEAPAAAPSRAATSADARTIAGALPRNVRHPGVDGRALLNRPRAFELMARYGVDGLVAVNPVNVYYLANTLPVGAKMRWEYPAFATLARDPQQPAFLVTTTGQAWDLVNGEREVPQLIAYSSVAGPGFAVREGVPLTPREQRWVESQQRYNLHSERSPALGLIRALRESGLERGRLAVDDLRVKYLLEQAGFTSVEWLPGDGLFRLIRMVKSEPEIALMRVAGRNNGDAALATMRAIERGMTFDDVERRFRLEAALRGNDVAFILAGVTLGLFPDGVAVPGKPFLVDAVSRYREYHGDFARTACIGEPSREVEARANRIGREAVFEIGRASRLLVSCATSPATRWSRRHARAHPRHQPAPVGLHRHPDHPVTLGLPGAPTQPFDHVLEENMTLTIDLPYVEVGWGAGHNEDLIRVTRNGYEALNLESDPLVIV